jgi:hypothetical protein
VVVVVVVVVAVAVAAAAVSGLKTWLHRLVAATIPRGITVIVSRNVTRASKLVLARQLSCLSVFPYLIICVVLLYLCR